MDEYSQIYLVNVGLMANQWNNQNPCLHYVYSFCRIRLFPQFIEDKERDWIYDQLFHELPWRQRSDVDKDGVTYLQPRLTAWYGDFKYSYSGVTHDANTEVSLYSTTHGAGHNALVGGTQV